MKLTTKILELLQQDATLTHKTIAAMTASTEEEVSAIVDQLTRDGVILGYTAKINSEKSPIHMVEAMIEVKVSPQRELGYNDIARRIYKFPEVEAVYLMSGSFDLTVIISGRTLKEVALFVGEKLAPLEDVTGTATHFILKKYKEKHLIFEKQEAQEERFVFD